MGFPQFPWSRYPDLAPPPDPRRRWRRRWVAVGAAVALAGLLAAGYWGVVRWIAWREKGILQKAETAFFEHDFRRAQLLLEQAVQVNPRNLDARRQLAEFYERFGSPLALARWQDAVALEPERDEARYALAGCALRLGQPLVAREALVGVSAPGREGLEFHRLAAGLALLADDRPTLEHHLAALAALEPGDARARFNLAALQLVSPDPATSAAGRAALVALARNGPLRIRATIELMRFASRTPQPEA